MNSIVIFLKKYKLPLIAVVLVWGFITFVQIFAISPLKKQNRELRQEIKERAKVNDSLKLKVSTDSIILIKKDQKIQAFDTLQAYYENLIIKNKQDYENQKRDYLGRSIIERRRIFSKLANE